MINSYVKTLKIAVHSSQIMNTTGFPQFSEQDISDMAEMFYTSVEDRWSLDEPHLKIIEMVEGVRSIFEIKTVYAKQVVDDMIKRYEGNLMDMGYDKGTLSKLVRFEH